MAPSSSFPTPSSSSSLFPHPTSSYILSFQFSSWYPLFFAHSIKSTVIRPLPQGFRAYLDADGVFVPEGSEDVPAESTLSDDEEEDGGEEEGEKQIYAFPELDARIRACVKEYGGVFPKLNFSSPKDAAWLLPASSPLKCIAPADVYLLLKSSDYITHDLSPERVFEGYIPVAETDTTKEDTTKVDAENKPKYDYELELVLRKWYSVDRGREVRCFVREGELIGISQRDTNFYEFWNDPDTQTRVVAAVRDFWAEHVKPKWNAQEDYTFDFLLTRDLSRGHIIDFNPYHPKTDPLLFTYEELHDLLQARRRALKERGTSSVTSSDKDKRLRQRADEKDTNPSTHALSLPILRVIDSAAHPAASKNAPVHQHNMIPFEALSLSSGHDIQQFADMWQESIKESTRDDIDVANKI